MSTFLQQWEHEGLNMYEVFRTKYYIPIKRNRFIGSHQAPRFGRIRDESLHRPGAGRTISNPARTLHNPAPPSTFGPEVITYFRECTYKGQMGLDAQANGWVHEYNVQTG
ncbi:unnamed protein product [Penicillium crustosum]